MNTALTISFAMIFASWLILPASAQAPYNSGMTPAEMNNFNTYLNNHPKTAQELAANPQLVKDPNFYSTHPDLESFLANHPGVREELNHNPGQFMRTEGGAINGTVVVRAAGRLGGMVMVRGLRAEEPERWRTSTTATLISIRKWLSSSPRIQSW